MLMGICAQRSVLICAVVLLCFLNEIISKHDQKKKKRVEFNLLINKPHVFRVMKGVVRDCCAIRLHIELSSIVGIGKEVHFPHTNMKEPMPLE